MPEEITNNAPEPAPLLTDHRIDADAIYKFGVMKEDQSRAVYADAWYPKTVYSVDGKQMMKPSPSKIRTIAEFVEFNPGEFSLEHGKIYHFFRQLGPDVLELVGQYSVMSRPKATLADRKARRGLSDGNATDTQNIDPNNYPMLPEKGNAYQASLWRQQAQGLQDQNMKLIDGQTEFTKGLLEQNRESLNEMKVMFQQMLTMKEEQVRAQEGEKREVQLSGLRDEFHKSELERIKRDDELARLNDKSVGMADVGEWVTTILAAPHIGGPLMAIFADKMGVKVPNGTPQLPTPPDPATQGNDSTPGFDMMTMPNSNGHFTKTQ